VIRQLAEDLIFQKLYGYQYGTKYLTDLPGEAQFFACSSPEDELQRKTAAMCARLQHSVPFLRELPLAKVLRIRREDSGSFTLYRQALGKILREYIGGRNEILDGDAKQIFRDILEPELIKLQRLALVQRRASGKKMIAKTLVPAAIVSLGVISGFLPSDVAQLAKIVGATTLLNQAAETFLDRTPPEQVHNHNLYFLLRLADEHASSHY
jgi:hypothetical protein